MMRVCAGCRKLGFIYLEGITLPNDQPHAVAAFFDGRQIGNPERCNNRAYLLENGVGEHRP